MFRYYFLLELDRRLVDYLPYFQTKNKALSDKITVRQLLSHTTGFPHEIGIANLVTPNKNELPNFKEWQENRDYLWAFLFRTNFIYYSLF
ncbi:serine hydrolase [Lottiidibacillus patelloidae]|uniref:serine hydrolase n=1 Tax=Lottiidibacillus patelloidae TaxID=2670334 RepID=UPI0011550B49